MKGTRLTNTYLLILKQVIFIWHFIVLVIAIYT